MEFAEGTKSLLVEQFVSLGLFLKDIFHLHLWTLNTFEELFTSLSPSYSTLFNVQLIMLGSKVFNNLISRNERIKFCSSQLWTWSIFNTAEFEVIPNLNTR